MDKNFWIAVAKRFGRAFVSGGIAQVAAVLVLQPAAFDWASLQSWLVMLVVSFVTGGLMALDKLVRYTPTTTQEGKQ